MTYTIGFNYTGGTGQGYDEVSLGYHVALILIFILFYFIYLFIFLGEGGLITHRLFWPMHIAYCSMYMFSSKN